MIARAGVERHRPFFIRAGWLVRKGADMGVFIIIAVVGAAWILFGG